MEFLKSEAQLLLFFSQIPALTCAVSGGAPFSKPPKDIIATEPKDARCLSANLAAFFNAEYVRKKATFRIEDRYDYLIDIGITTVMTQKILRWYYKF